MTKKFGILTKNIFKASILTTGFYLAFILCQMGNDFTTKLTFHVIENYLR